MCNREAPEVEQFAREHGDRVEVIGLGTQDSYQQALDFVDQHDTRSFTMLWDESFVSWQVIGVSSQPAALMLAPDGTPIDGWLGMFPIDRVLEYAEEHSA